jgi:hypothetical protein
MKAAYARNLPEPVKVALRMRDKLGKSPDELLKWIKDLNPGLHTEHWRVLDRQPELKGQKLILLIDWDSHTAIKETGYDVFTRLTQGTVKVLRDPEAGPQEEEGATMSPVSSGSVSKEKRTVTSTPSGTRIAEWRRATEVVGEMSPTVKPAPVDPGAPLEGTWSAKKGKGKEEMETDPPPSKPKG